MNCDEIQQALDGDATEFKAAVRHIKKCPYCSNIYKDELEMEFALRNLNLENETVDVLPELYKKLELEKRDIKTSVLIKRWAWVPSAILGAWLIVLNLDGVTNMVNQAMTLLGGANLSISESDKSAINGIAESFRSSGYFIPAILLAGGSLAGLFYYLWRELKEIAR